MRKGRSGHVPRDGLLGREQSSDAPQTGAPDLTLSVSTSRIFVPVRVVGCHVCAVCLVLTEYSEKLVFEMGVKWVAKDKVVDAAGDGSEDEELESG